MKKLYASLFIVILLKVCLLLVVTGGAKSATSAQLIPTNTPAPVISAILVDTGETLYCYWTPQNVAGTPYPHPIFWTATALASVSPSPSPTATSTTVSLQTKTATPIWQTPEATSTFPTPTQEFASPSPIVITYTVQAQNGLNIRSCASTTCTITGKLGYGVQDTFTGKETVSGSVVFAELTGGRGWAAKSQNGVAYLQ